jgi:hypothetical protein
MDTYDTSLTIMNNEPFKPNNREAVACGVDCPIHADTVVSWGIWSTLASIWFLLVI